MFEDPPNGVGRGEEGDHLAARAAVLADENIDGMGTAEQLGPLQALVATITRDKLTLTPTIDKKHLGASLKITNNAPMTQREFGAAVLRLAAEIEEKSEGERWLVHVERGEAWGAPGRETRTARVWIEAVTGSEDEEQRALATLIAVVTT